MESMVKENEGKGLPSKGTSHHIHSSSRKLPQITAEMGGSHGDNGGIVELNQNDFTNETTWKNPDEETDAQKPEGLARNRSTMTSEGAHTKEGYLEACPQDSGSVAYISETLIKQITKEERLDMITSLTIHFPKDKLNKKIKYIENLEKLKRLQTLNLSNNMIEKMQKLETLSELRELNLSNNCIKIIECIDNMSKLEALNLNSNEITSIPRLTIKKIRCLKVLKLSHNKLDSLLEITKLRPLQDLTNLDLQGNPFSTLPHYRHFVIYQLRSLHVLDNQTVTKEERRQADMRFSQEELQRLEVELSKQEKLYQTLQEEKYQATRTIEQLMKTQNILKEKEKRQAQRMKELEQDIEAKNSLVKAKNADLIKASEKQYRLEQELAFYKLDAKFELLGQMPLVDENVQIDEEDVMDDSTYIGKATFKRNQFTRESNLAGGVEQAAYVTSLRRDKEKLEKMGAELDRMLNDKKEALRQLQRQLDDKTDQLRNVSEKLASLELSLAGQMATVGQGNDMARKQLAQKIEFIKRLQAAAEELEARMKIVANDLEEKRKELEELVRKKDRLGGSGDDPQLEQALRSKEAELKDAYKNLSKMKEDLELLNQQIAEEQAEVERLRRELGEDSLTSQEANELKEVILALNKRLEELQNLAKEQQTRIKDLEEEGEELRDEVEEGKDSQATIEELEQKLQYALVALENEEKKSQEAEARANEFQERLSAFEKNNKLGLMEADRKLKHANNEINKLQDNAKKLKAQLENEREATKVRVQRDQERIAKALEAARGLGDKEREVKDLTLQVNALKATNEALKDRLDEAEHELKQRKKDVQDKDDLLKRLNDLLNDLDRGHIDVREPQDETDGVGECLADLHRKYLDLLNDLESEREKRKRQQKQANAAVDGLKKELSRARSQLKAAEKALAQLGEDAAKKENELKDLEDEIERLRDRLQQPTEKLQDEVKHVRALAKRLKDRLGREIQELQAELQELRDKYFDELQKKDEEIAELEAIISENASNSAGEEEKRKLRRDLNGLKRLLSDRLKANKEAIENEKKINRAQQKMDESRRRIEADLRNAENKIHSVENLLKNKQRESKAQDRNVDALAHELNNLKQALDLRDRARSSTTNPDYNIHSHDDLMYHHYPNTNTGHHNTLSQEVPPNPTTNEVHHYLYNNNATSRSPARQNVSTVPAVDVVHHHHHDNIVLQTPVDASAATTVNHRHHHYGNGDFTVQLKKKRTKKKDYCNVSEHENLEDDLEILEEKLASTNSKLSSQRTENKLNSLRSDLQNLEHTVSDSMKGRTPTRSGDYHLDETLAKLQDHMLTLMDHQANLLSQNS